MIYAFFTLIFAGFCSMAYLYFSARTRLDAYKPIVDLNSEIKEKEQSLAEAQAEYQELRNNINNLSHEVTLLNEDSNLLSSGFYKVKYDFQNSKEYETKLEDIRRIQKEMIQNRKAIVCDTEWMVSGSKALGKKMTERTIKLGLAAFNVQCDNEILKVQFNNIGRAEEKIAKIRDSINKLLEPNSCQITDDFFHLKLAELHLVYAYQEKLHKEKDAQRLKLVHLKDEEMARAEIETIQMKTEREERRYHEALEKMKKEVDKAAETERTNYLSKIAELESKLKDTQTLKAQVKSQANRSGLGFVYILSNIGVLGENVFKIGMTKRLDPVDRIYELSHGSLPFDYDIHALIQSDDAAGLEAAIHQELSAKRINKMNAHKDFFKTDLAEIEAVCRKHYTGEIKFNPVAEAKEWRQTLALNKTEKKKAA